MASKARKAFDKNVEDIERLIEIHKQEGCSSRRRRYRLEVLNKSAIVLITACWEAYCEDIAAEGLAHIVAHAKSADGIPKHLKKQLAKDLKEDPNELALWSIADGGWKAVLTGRLEKLREERNWSMNAPKAGKVDELFERAIGIPDITASWKWGRRMSAKRARVKLDKYVALRGSIAHRGQALKGVTKASVVDYFEFVKQLAAKTGGAVNRHVKDITGVPLWQR